jgi:hypothetical protein
MTVFGVNNISQISLENISDVVAINTHIQYEGGYQGYSTSSSGFRHTVGGHKGRSVYYGDLVISSFLQKIKSGIIYEIITRLLD